MRFYAGIASVALFDTIFTLIKLYIPHITYWKGAKHALRVLRRTGRKKMTSLNPHDEFLLALMDYDCADRFDISPTKSSFIFTTWIKLLRKLLKNLVAWLLQEAIRDNLPEAFIKTGNNKCRVILDCAEVFKLKDQNHLIVKLQPILIINTIFGISSSSFITFKFMLWWPSKFITKDSGFYDLLERDNVVMTDRGFQIQEDLLLHFCNVQVPPGEWTKSQITKREVQKTKEFANLRIHVERAINRIKNY